MEHTEFERLDRDALLRIATEQAKRLDDAQTAILRLHSMLRGTPPEADAIALVLRRPDAIALADVLDRASECETCALDEIEAALLHALAVRLRKKAGP